MRVALFQKVRGVFQIYKSPKKIFQITLMNLKSKFVNSEQHIFKLRKIWNIFFFENWKRNLTFWIKATFNMSSKDQAKGLSTGPVEKSLMSSTLNWLNLKVFTFAQISQNGCQITTRYRPRFFDKVGHQITYAGNNRQTYQNWAHF